MFGVGVGGSYSNSDTRYRFACGVLRVPSVRVILCVVLLLGSGKGTSSSSPSMEALCCTKSTTSDDSLRGTRKKWDHKTLAKTAQDDVIR